MSSLYFLLCLVLCLLALTGTTESTEENDDQQVDPLKSFMIKLGGEQLDLEQGYSGPECSVLTGRRVREASRGFREEIIMPGDLFSKIRLSLLALTSEHTTKADEDLLVYGKGALLDCAAQDGLITVADIMSDSQIYKNILQNNTQYLGLDIKLLANHGSQWCIIRAHPSRTLPALSCQQVLNNISSTLAIPKKDLSALVTELGTDKMGYLAVTSEGLSGQQENEMRTLRCKSFESNNLYFYTRLQQQYRKLLTNIGRLDDNLKVNFYGSLVEAFEKCDISLRSSWEKLAKEQQKIRDCTGETRQRRFSLLSIGQDSGFSTALPVINQNFNNVKNRLKDLQTQVFAVKAARLLESQELLKTANAITVEGLETFTLQTNFETNRYLQHHRRLVSSGLQIAFNEILETNNKIDQFISELPSLVDNNEDCTGSECTQTKGHIALLREGLGIIRKNFQVEAEVVYKISCRMKPRGESHSAKIMQGHGRQVSIQSDGNLIDKQGTVYTPECLKNSEQCPQKLEIYDPSKFVFDNLHIYGNSRFGLLFQCRRPDRLISHYNNSAMVNEIPCDFTPRQLHLPAMLKSSKQTLHTDLEVITAQIPESATRLAEYSMSRKYVNKGISAVRSTERAISEVFASTWSKFHLEDVAEVRAAAGIGAGLTLALIMAGLTLCSVIYKCWTWRKETRRKKEDQAEREIELLEKRRGSSESVQVTEKDMKKARNRIAKDYFKQMEKSNKEERKRLEKEEKKEEERRQREKKEKVKKKADEQALAEIGYLALPQQKEESEEGFRRGGHQASSLKSWKKQRERENTATVDLDTWRAHYTECLKTPERR